VRIAFLSREGAYLPPYGHRTDINNARFQDYGADLKLGADSFAYVDGAFHVELPVGEVHVWITKGMEYEPVRRTIEIAPGQRELKLQIGRRYDWRAQGWVTADTHVHYISPSTAVLEAQAEGLNLVNLLAAQLGEFYINIGDLAHGPLAAKDGETVVWVGTENRSHMLGHIGLLGGEGEAVYPLSGGFPLVSDTEFFGDPVRALMAEWSDGCRARGGLSVAVHFPFPTAELAADIVLGKIDAVELSPRFDSLGCLHWYHYLNCGYRLPVVGGTDKMGASMAVGLQRTYAHLGGAEFNFANWTKAVRGGNTFTTTGPLLLFQVEGRPPGGEIELGGGNGELEFRLEARSCIPFQLLELVYNGRVVASHEARDGTREAVWQDKVKVSGPGWLAARCSTGSGLRTNAAHTSPVYLRVRGQEVFSPPAAAFMLSLIEGTQVWLQTMATRPDLERLAQMQKTLAQARSQLEERLHRHSALPHDPERQL
jgi:hypothetical protein